MVGCRREVFGRGIGGEDEQIAVGRLPEGDDRFVVVDALRKLGPGADAQKLRDYLATLKGYAGINGIFDFKASPQRGLDEHNTAVTLWDAAAQNWNIVSEPTGTPLRN